MSDLPQIVCMDKPQKKKKSNIHKNLMQPPFRLIITGASNKGKSNYICNLFRKGFYKGVWKKENIIIISSTINLDDKMRDCIPSLNHFDRYSDEIINEVFEQQEAILRTYGKKKMPAVLFILDDLLGTKCYALHSAITENIFKCRHYNVSFIFSVQKLNAIPRVIRLNADAISIFQATNLSELDSCVEEFATKAMRKQFYKVLNEIFSVPYQFLHIDYKRPFKERYSKGLSEIINFDT